MKIHPGIVLLKEIEGHGSPIEKGDRFEAVFKFFHNRCDPILFNTCWHKPIPEIVTVDGKEVVGWKPGETQRTNVIYEHDGWLARQSDILPGLYYSLLGMKAMGFRKVKIAPHFMSNSMGDGTEIKKGSIVKAEIFLLSIRKSA